MDTDYAWFIWIPTFHAKMHLKFTQAKEIKTNRIAQNLKLSG